MEVNAVWVLEEVTNKERKSGQRRGREGGSEGVSEVNAVWVLDEVTNKESKGGKRRVNE